MEIAVQLVPQTAVALANPPPSTTALLVIVEFIFTLAWLVKLKALTIPVVTVQVEEVMEPTVTVAVLVIL
jgi:hypothetical protein